MDGGDFPYGSGPPDIGQWDTIESTTEVTPSGATVTETSWEPNVLEDDPEEGQSGTHGPEQPGGDTGSEADDVWFGNTLEPDGSRQEATDASTDHQVRQGPPEPEDDEDEQDQEEQDGGPEAQTNDGPAQDSGDSMPIPPEADDGTGGGGGDLDRSSIGGNVDPAFEAEPAGDAGDLIGGRGDIDYDPELADAGGGGALDHQLLGAVDPVDGDLKLDAGDPAELADAFAPEDALGDLDVEFDDSPLDAALGFEDAAG